MIVSFSHPQEDEFALLALGAPSPILRLAFPNDPPMHMEMLDMEGVSAPDLARWKRAMFDFIRAQTYLKGKPLVLKSPPHTGRIRLLAEMFPQAKFIHLVRDPYSLFPSTRRLWYALEQVQGFQVPRYEYLDDYVFAAFERMYRGFDQQRPFIDDSPSAKSVTKTSSRIRWANFAVSTSTSISATSNRSATRSRPPSTPARPTARLPTHSKNPSRRRSVTAGANISRSTAMQRTGT